MPRESCTTSPYNSVVQTVVSQREVRDADSAALNGELLEHMLMPEFLAYLTSSRYGVTVMKRMASMPDLLISSSVLCESAQA